MAPYLPSTVTSGPTQPCPNITGTVTLTAGIYTCQLNVPPSANVTLKSGVFQLESGITVASGATVSVQSGGGALLYLSSGAATFDPGATVTIPPLTAAQSLAASATSVPPTTALQDVWLWQDASDSAPATLIGNGQGSQTSGVAYVPAAPVDLSNSAGSDATGGIIAQSVSMTPAPPGSAKLTVTGQ